MTSNLLQSGVLVSIEIGWPRLHRQLDKNLTRVVFRDLHIDNIARTQPRWKLMPNTWAEKFSEIEHQARYAVIKYAYGMRVAGLYLIPIGKFHDFYKESNDLKKRFYDLVDSFINNYEEIKNIKAKEIEKAILNESFSKDEVHALRVYINRLFDDKEKIRSQFKYLLYCVPVANPHLALSVLNEISDILQDESSELSNRIKPLLEKATELFKLSCPTETAKFIENQYSQFSKQAVDNLLLGPKRILEDTCYKILEAYKRGKNFHTSVLERFKDIVSLLLSFRSNLSSYTISRLAEVEELSANIEKDQMKDNNDLKKIIGELRKAITEDIENSEKKIRKFAAETIEI